MATNIGERVLRPETGKKKDLVLFPCENIAEIILRLRALGVEAREASVKRPERVRGVIVERWQMATLLKIFGLTTEDIMNVGQTEVPNLILIKKKGGPEINTGVRVAERDIVNQALAKVQGVPIIDLPLPPKKKNKKPTTIEEIRAAFIEITGSNRLALFLSELPGAVQEASKATSSLIDVERKCQSALAVLNRLSTEREFLEEKIMEECNRLVEMGVEIEGHPQVVYLCFATDKGLRKLKFGGDQSVVVMDKNAGIIELPVEITIPVTGFIACHDFADAVLLLRNYFANDDEEVKHGRH